MKKSIRKFFNIFFNQKSLAKLFLLTSISLFIPTSVSYVIFVNSKNKVISKNDYLFQDSKLLGYEWIDFKPISLQFADLESYENYFEEYLKVNQDNTLPRKLTSFISSQFKHGPQNINAPTIG